MLFLDIETQNSWTRGEQFPIDEMKISYTGVIDDDGTEIDVWEDNMKKLLPLIQKTDMIVGYNIFGFDMPIIANYLGKEILELPQLDLMVAAYKALGFRPKLNALTTATFGESKIGNGADAVVYYATGQLDKLRAYCMEDVRLTKKLYEFGKNNGYVKYYDRGGFVKEVKINWELGKKVPAPQAGTISMF